MLIIEGIKWLLLAAEIGIALPVLYLCIISASAILAARRMKLAAKRADSPAHVTINSANFAILIPAHNEQAVLGILLDSLSQLAYSRDHFTVYVVADNCTDDTAGLARATGWVCVYERFDSEKRGKGFALNWIMQKLGEDQCSHDAYIILDADSIVTPTFLQSMSQALARGARALQGCNTVLNVTDSPSTVLRWLALTLMNHVRPLGRNGLGASSNLSGNGMCLSRALLEQYPWRAFALAEDYQYYLTLIEHGERVHYVPDALVRSQMPTTFSQMRTQDIRWESSSGGESKWRVALRLLKAGLRNRDFARLEAIGEFFTPPLSLLVSSSFLALVLSLVVWSLPEVTISLLLVGGLIGYVATALYLMRPPSEIYKALLHAPGFMIWKLWVIFVLRKSRKHVGEWVRTSRT